MTQYALMQRGRIVNVVTTRSSEAALQQRWPEYTVTPLDSVPLNVCEDYEYWNTRP